MRVAFYAPMKPPHHPQPSGDRLMARLLMSALERAGHDVELACSFRSFDGAGNAVRQRRLARLGRGLADALAGRYRRRPPGRRPHLWFSYHVYHKAPDWLGPAVSRALGLPYVIAEASHAPKQRDGPWAVGHAAAAEAISRADLVFALNPADSGCVGPLLCDRRRLVPLKPFIDARPYLGAAEQRARHRRIQVERFGLDPGEPLLLTVAMMRPGDKLESYRLLGHALASLLSRPWRLAVVGDGPAEDDVRAALAPLAERVIWQGRLEGADLASIYAASDVLVWPAIGEAYGLALLEAQAAGVPVVAGRTGGVPAVVGDGDSGLLTAVGCADALAGAVATLLDDPETARAMGERARTRIALDHDLPVAARRIAAAFDALTGGSAR